MSSTSQMQRIPHRIDEPAQQARVPFLRWTQRSDLDVPRIEQAVIARFLDDPLRRRNGEAGDDRFRAGRRGFDDAPGDADCTAFGSIMPAEYFSESRRKQRHRGFRDVLEHELRKPTPVMNKAGNAPFHVIDRDGLNWTACWSELN